LLIVDIYSVKLHLFIETSVIRVSIPFRSDSFTVKPGRGGRTWVKRAKKGRQPWKV